MESESEWNRTDIFWGGIGIGIELNITGPESELNRNRVLPELHIIGSDLFHVFCGRFSVSFRLNVSLHSHKGETIHSEFPF